MKKYERVGIFLSDQAVAFARIRARLQARRTVVL